MAEWQYLIHRLEIDPSAEFDQQWLTTLEDLGAKGWELSEVLEPKNDTNLYRLIFKSSKPLTS